MGKLNKYQVKIELAGSTGTYRSVKRDIKHNQFRYLDRTVYLTWLKFDVYIKRGKEEMHLFFSMDYPGGELQRACFYLEIPFRTGCFEVTEFSRKEHGVYTISENAVWENVSQKWKCIGEKKIRN